MTICFFLKTKSLSWPYTNCTKDRLELYPHSNYTQPRCSRQEQTRMLANECHCKGADMPGELLVSHIRKHGFSPKAQKTPSLLKI